MGSIGKLREKRRKERAKEVGRVKTKVRKENVNEKKGERRKSMLNTHTLSLNRFHFESISKEADHFTEVRREWGLSTKPYI